VFQLPIIFKIGDNVSPVFTKVLDEMRLGLVDEDEEVQAPADRAYWEKRAAKTTMAMTDELFASLKTLDSQLELKYNKFYIGLARNGESNTFVIFRPKKEWLRVELRLEKTNELDAKLEEAGLDVMEYDSKWGKYRIRITKNDFKKQEELLRQLLRQAYENAMA
jgi:predicted transport protein